ncbi:MAG: Gfo/Idh/MocA family protein [Lachnospirales bacterium]
MKKIKIGVIGLGNRGVKFAKNIILENENFSLHSVCDYDKKDFDFFINKGIKTYIDYNELLSDSELEAVMICTPENTHLEILEKSIKKNLHIICEKPLEISKDKTVEMSKLCNGYNKTILVGYVLRYAPLYIKAKELVEKGAIGDVILCNAVDNVVYGGYAFFRDWHRHKKNINSLILQKSSHSLDIINWVINDTPKKIATFGSLEVYGSKGRGKWVDVDTDEFHCRTCPYEKECFDSNYNIKEIKGINWNDNWHDRCVFSKDIDIDDNHTIMIEYEKGSKVVFSSSQFSPFYRRSYEFIGTRGSLYFDDKENIIKINYKDKKEEENILVDVGNLVHSGGDINLLDDFYESITANKKPVADFDSCFISSMLCFKSIESQEKGNIVFFKEEV